jgi:hypothetical protein
MRKIDADTSREQLIQTINSLIESNIALTKMVLNLTIASRFDKVEKDIKDLEARLIKEGDIVVSLLNQLNSTKHII